MGNATRAEADTERRNTAGRVGGARVPNTKNPMWQDMDDSEVGGGGERRFGAEPIRQVCCVYVQTSRVLYEFYV